MENGPLIYGGITYQNGDVLKLCQSLPEGKPPFSHGFPRVFPFSHGFSHGFFFSSEGTPSQARNDVVTAGNLKDLNRVDFWGF